MKYTASRMPSPRAVGLGLLALIISASIGGRGNVFAQPEDSQWIETEGAASAKTPEIVIRKWPELAQKTANAMIEKYGLPHHYSDSALVWDNNGPWLKTVVHRGAWPHRPGMRDTDYLEQTIHYEVPLNAAADIRRFDKRIKVDFARNELSARSESEQMNFLAFNLADEIAQGNRSVQSARTFYSKTAALEKAGKTSRYTSRLLFTGHPFMNQVFYP